VAGKTGTAENPAGEDHSLWVGYAPYEDPSIVVAVVMENAGRGASYAAPVACQTFAGYLRFDPERCGDGSGTISR
jgi:penicillin-binding protein 2